MSFLSTYAFRLAAFLNCLRRLYCFISEITFGFIVFLFFSGRACVVVSSYPVRWHFTCLALVFSFFFFGSPSVQQPVTTESASL